MNDLQGAIPAARDPLAGAIAGTNPIPSPVQHHFMCLPHERLMLPSPFSRVHLKLVPRSPSEAWAEILAEGFEWCIALLPGGSDDRL
jgi:hypothetical protein